jgi:hypothetical protein
LPKKRCSTLGQAPGPTANIRLAWKSLLGTNAQADCENSQLTTVKSFVKSAAGVINFANLFDIKTEWQFELRHKFLPLPVAQILQSHAEPINWQVENLLYNFTLSSTLYYNFINLKLYICITYNSRSLSLSLYYLKNFSFLKRHYGLDGAILGWADLLEFGRTSNFGYFLYSPLLIHKYLQNELPIDAWVFLDLCSKNFHPSISFSALSVLPNGAPLLRGRIQNSSCSL